MGIGDTTDEAVMWVPGEEQGKNASGEVVDLEKDEVPEEEETPEESGAPEDNGN